MNINNYVDKYSNMVYRIQESGFVDMLSGCKDRYVMNELTSVLYEVCIKLAVFTMGLTALFLLKLFFFEKEK